MQWSTQSQACCPTRAHRTTGWQCRGCGGGVSHEQGKYVKMLPIDRSRKLIDPRGARLQTKTRAASRVCAANLVVWPLSAGAFPRHPDTKIHAVETGTTAAPTGMQLPYLRPTDALGHTLTPFCSVCRQFSGFIPSSVHILQISSDNVHPVFPSSSRCITWRSILACN